MRVLVARELGMCFGVRDAIEFARDVDSPADVTIFGEIVHNPIILSEMRERGFATVSETDRTELPLTPSVMITAHGLGDRSRERLEHHGKRVIDTTCPLVRNVHDKARELAAGGFFVVVVGKPDHVEVRGIVEDLERCSVVETPEDAVELHLAARADIGIGVVCQTTVPPWHAARVVAAIRRANPGTKIRFEDTICQPTRARQEAVLELLDQIDALVVVGGPNSNNTRQLGLLAESRGLEWFHVADADDLDIEALRRFEVVGLTAGTSTEDESIAAVHAALVEIEGATREARGDRQESLEALPYCARPPVPR